MDQPASQASTAVNAPEQQPDYGKMSFVRMFVLPAFLLFLIPILSLLFFKHAQHTFEEDVRAQIIQDVRSDPEMSDEDKTKATEFFETAPMSRLMSDPEFTAGFDSTFLFNYNTFRWMNFLCLLSIGSAILVFLFSLVCVLLSQRSQSMQYFSLVTCWNILRIFGAMQALIQGTLIVALSFWVTALWANRYYPKLIFIAGALAVCAAGYVIYAIFKRPKQDFAIEGEVIEKEAAGPLWIELQQICDAVGTEPPDQIVAGIDNNFFVTEQPVHVGEQILTGRTLFVSLSLLKQLDGEEADAVLAHEMAHFSGNDTLFSKRIAPLLARYDNYLTALHAGGITLPIFYFMLCFRGMYEWSIGKQSRTREYRADSIAADVTSPEAISCALARVIAYGAYRNKVEQELFDQQEVMESADISDRIEKGFAAYSSAFLDSEDLSGMRVSHPFDSHPPLEKRLLFLKVPLDSEVVRNSLDTSGNGHWYDLLNGANLLEKQQWNAYEENFRAVHEESLAWRFLPETPAEQALVEKYFPEVVCTGNKGNLTINYKEVNFEHWDEPVSFDNFTNPTYDAESNQFTFQCPGEGKKKETKKLKLKKFDSHKDQEILQLLTNYYARYETAKAVQQQLASDRLEAAQTEDVAL